MTAEDLAAAVSAVFIVAMVWLRTRMHYIRRGSGGLTIQRAGWWYFAAVLAVLAIGWIAAPMLGRGFLPVPGAHSVVTRVLWFLATYYVFILVHRLMLTKHVEVFRARETL